MKLSRSLKVGDKVFWYSDSEMRLELMTFFSLSNVFLHNPSSIRILNTEITPNPSQKVGLKVGLKSVEGLLQGCFTKTPEQYSTDINDYFLRKVYLMVREKGLEPPRIAAQDPKSCVSTNSTTLAENLL